MGMDELRERAERYRKLAGECCGSELAALLRVYAAAYEDEAATLERRKMAAA
jgi:hypothetical protein